MDRGLGPLREKIRVDYGKDELPQSRGDAQPQRLVSGARQVVQQSFCLPAFPQDASTITIPATIAANLYQLFISSMF